MESELYLTLSSIGEVVSGATRVWQSREKDFELLEFGVSPITATDCSYYRYSYTVLVPYEYGISYHVHRVYD